MSDADKRDLRWCLAGMFMGIHFGMCIAFTLDVVFR